MADEKLLLTEREAAVIMLFIEAGIYGDEAISQELKKLACKIEMRGTS